MLFGGCAWSPFSATRPTGPETLALAEGMSSRLAIAQKVAWAKYRDRLPVADPAREEALLLSIESLAPSHGLTPEVARRFFQAQIKASRLEQERWLQQWSRGAVLPDFAPFSLKGDIRPELDRLTPQLLAGLREYLESGGQRADLFTALRREGWSWWVANAAAGF